MLDDMTLAILFPALLMQEGVVSLVLKSGFFAKIILACLLLLSVLSWAITLNKYWQFKRINNDFQRLLHSLRPNSDVAAVYHAAVKDIGGPVGRIFEEGYVTIASHFESPRGRQLEIPTDGALHAIEKDVNLRLQTASASEISSLAGGIPFLATATSLSPFLGLLGTVWGVMNTFLGISQAGGSADLSVVAPGIAEALVATAAGLLVAIPALLCNNFLSARLNKIEDDFSRLNTELIIYFNRVIHREKLKNEDRLGHQRHFAA
jgi:biopolymer transport protein TolQ